MPRKRSASTRNESINMPPEPADTAKEIRPANLRRGWATYYKLILPFLLIFVGYWFFFRRVSASSNFNPTTGDSRRLSKFCSTPFLGKPLVQYALMIDAGSSGSRIHVYRFNYCKDTPDIEDEVFEQKQPGLSSYIDNPEEAAKSLDSLLDVALKAVPDEMQSCTPVAVKATAGLRLHKEKATDVLEAVKKRIITKYPFPLVPKEPVAIMDGKDEGVYAWITVNYLLGKLNSNSPKFSSVATIDLGGGSVQIVFEPSFQSGNNLEKGDHQYTLDFAGNTHQLYQHSYLGFGLNEARKAIKALVVEDWLEGNNPSDTNIPIPCFTLGSKEDFSYNGSTYTLEGTETSEIKCEALIKRVFSKEDACHVKPCSFKGVYQPKLVETFKTNDIYVFSFFYDRTYPFGLRDKFKVKDIKKLAKRVCSGDFTSFEQYPGAVQELQTKYHRCLDITYLHSLLNTGFDLEPERQLISAKKINDLETGWCLGASIAVLHEKDYCPAS